MTTTEMSAVIYNLLESYSRDELLNGWYFYTLNFFKERPGKKWENVQSNSLWELINKKKNPNKEDIAIVCFSVLFNKEIFNEFLTSLPAHIPVLIEKLLFVKYLDRNEIQLITGKDVLDAPQLRHYGVTINREFNLFSNKLFPDYYGYHKQFEQIETKTWLPKPLKKVLIDYYPKPKGYYLDPVDNPENTNLLFFNAEESINRELPTLITYYLQNQIKYSEKGHPNATGMKKLQRTIQLQEFYPDSEFSTIRSMLVASLIFSYKINEKITNVPDIIRFLFEVHFAICPLGLNLLNQLKGFGYFDLHDFFTSTNKDIWEILSQTREGEWVTMENLHTFTKYRSMDLLPISVYDLSYKVYYETRDKRREYIDETMIEHSITRPMLAGAVFLFSAFGLFEICYEGAPVGEVGTDWYSEYDNLKMLRLTGLGAYVLGHRKDYVPPVSKGENRLLPDLSSLMIRVEGNAELAQVQLSNYAQKISDNRYQLSPALFLKDCKSATDIKNKITFFRQSIGQDFPPFWDEYFKKLLQNNKLITSEKNLSVYRLSSADKELHRLIAQDEVLKKLVIKAEQFYIIIEKSNEAAFRNRLREAGILLDL